MPGNIEKWIGNSGGLIVSAKTSPTVMSPGWVGAYSVTLAPGRRNGLKNGSPWM